MKRSRNQREREQKAKKQTMQTAPSTLFFPGLFRGSNLLRSALTDSQLVQFYASVFTLSAYFSYNLRAMRTRPNDGCLSHCGSELPRIQTEVLGHSLVRWLVRSHGSFICLLRTACSASALHRVHSLARSLTHSRAHGEVNVEESGGFEP